MKQRIAEMYRDSQRELYAENLELIAALRGMMAYAEDLKQIIETASNRIPPYSHAEKDARALLARIDGKEQEG